MLIRLAQAEDAENLSALAMQIWLHTYADQGISSTISGYVLTELSPSRFTSLLSDPSSVVHVAEVEKHLVGYATVCLATSCPESTQAKAELATLHVQEPFVGKGVGTLLLKQSEYWAKGRTDKNIWLTVNSKNSRAISFYAKHGYVKLGITYFQLGDEKHENFVLAGPDV